MTTLQFFIIWPERRYVQESTIRMWFADTFTPEEVRDVVDVAEMARMLDDVGHITLGKPRFGEARGSKVTK
jgi:hypothetical protein